MIVFYRSGLTELWISITSSEILGDLTGGYVEDYYGTVNQLTLFNTTTGIRTPVLMNEDTDITPGIPHDAFIGVVDLALLPNAVYRLEGRVKDTLGNFRILSEVETPLGTEQVTLYEILITDGFVTVLNPKAADVAAKIPLMSVGELRINSMGASVGTRKGIESSIAVRNSNFGVSVATTVMAADVSTESRFNVSIATKEKEEVSIREVYAI